MFTDHCVNFMILAVHAWSRAHNAMGDAYYMRCLCVTEQQAQFEYHLERAIAHVFTREASLHICRNYR